MKRQQLKRFVLFLITPSLVTAVTLGTHQFAFAAGPDLEQSAELADAEKEVVKVTDQGLIPPTITLQKQDSSVFFVNTTKDSLVTVSIDFGEHSAHCATSNLKFENGSMHSVEPIGPKDFALTCFPQKGSYDVKVEGVAGKNAPLVGKVIVP
ncbi:MAG: hypothetical protein U0136_12880 [Bdellovibrionota bacterium]